MSISRTYKPTTRRLTTHGTTIEGQLSCHVLKVIIAHARLIDWEFPPRFLHRCVRDNQLISEIGLIAQPYLELNFKYADYQTLAHLSYSSCVCLTSVRATRAQCFLSVRVIINASTTVNCAITYTNINPGIVISE